jgi:4-amino-4-deoxy-L-arabinose transferase-like glycosyltransferase
VLLKDECGTIVRGITRFPHIRGFSDTSEKYRHLHSRIDPIPLRPIRLALLLIVVVAFSARLGLRLVSGEDEFWRNGYSSYYALAENFVSGKGLCFKTTCAWWPPLYPMFLALGALGWKHYLLIVVPQALVGTGTVLLAYLIGAEVFGARVGILASMVTAVYPYYVRHDTALQETGLLTFWIALSVFLLIRAHRLERRRDWISAGLALAAIALTRASISPFVALALLWAACSAPHGSLTAKFRPAALMLLSLTLTIGPWLIRNWRISGAPVLTSQTGRALWIGNNAETFSRYPNESIDLSTGKALQELSVHDRIELKGLSDREIETSDWYARKAVGFIREHPWTTIRGATRKLLAGFSWRLNPLQGPFAQWTYFLSYAPISILGLAGMFLARNRAESRLIALLFASFVGVTSLFWAHTSHRSHLDIYLIIFSASVCVTIFDSVKDRLRFISPLESGLWL